MDELRQAQERRALLSAYLLAGENIGEVIECCTRASDTDDDPSGVLDAQDRLMRRFDITEIQADAVLLLQLRRLTPASIERMRVEWADADERCRILTDPAESAGPRG